MFAYTATLEFLCILTCLTNLLLFDLTYLHTALISLITVALPLSGTVLPTYGHRAV